MGISIVVLLAGLVGAVPLILIARRYNNVLPLMIYGVMLLGTATVMGHPHDFRTGTAVHGLVAVTGLGFLWFTYNGHKQVKQVRATLRKQGMVRVNE